MNNFSEGKMSLTMPYVYKQKDFSHLKGLAGISDKEVQVHLGLYGGYVANTNKLNELLAEMTRKGESGTPKWAELNRRAGWEYNGMRLHEFYFGNLYPKGKGQPGAKLTAGLEKTFGSFEAWKQDFFACATMRGIGWVILYYDPQAGTYSNHWITEHDIGHPAGFKPVLVLDMWEHAFMVDYVPADKKKYIDAFFGNVDWDEVESRLD